VHGILGGKELLLKLYAKLGSAGLLLVVALTLVSCGGTGGSMQGMDHGDKSGKEKSGGMSGMNHEDMDHGEGAQGKQEDKKKAADGGMAGMDHSNMEHGSGGMASEMLMENGEYSDERFIDSMVPHHQGAIDMAEVALENAEHREIRNLAEDIISTQEAEIEQLKSIKREEFGTSDVPMEMSAEEMEMMGMMADPQELANEEHFDRAFIDNMIPHHEAAIDMAIVTLGNSENPQIREIARTIVDAQQREIAKMQRWRQQWYPGG
jgi:uncharacterized protein (DUF305 family)